MASKILVRIQDEKSRQLYFILKVSEKKLSDEIYVKKGAGIFCFKRLGGERDIFFVTLRSTATKERL